GHDHSVRSVKFSPDSSRVASGSESGIIRVWLVETGELAFEPIKCHDAARCVCYSPSGDRTASVGKGIQIWDAETGGGILSIQNSKASSLVWTADGTHVIGDGGNISIWNSHNGERLRTWKAHDNTFAITTLSLSPTGTHLVTSNWWEKLAFVFNVSTGKQVTAFKHEQDSCGIAYSPSGKFIATACKEKKVYVWEVPAFEGPQTKVSFTLVAFMHR
ncbi:WD40 repeat-like protein, partial [Paxillus ammoniavirescens]